MITTEYDIAAYRWRGRVLLAFSLLLAMCLAIMPLPHLLHWLRPDWMLLVLLYWVLADEPRVSVSGAWLMGLAVDLLLGTLLGLHALIYAVIIFIAQRNRNSVARLPMWQQVLFVVICVLLSLIIQLVVYHSIGLSVVTPGYFVSLLMGPLLWPWLSWLLNGLQRQAW